MNSSFDQTAFDQVTALVEETETRSAAELVVAIVPQSGSYRDVDLWVGSIVAVGWICFIVFNPWTVHPPWFLPFEIVLGAAFGGLLSRWCPPVRRLCCTAARRTAQVHEACDLMFYREGIRDTRDHSGILIYLSLLEKRIEVVPDRGVLAAVPTDPWNTAVFELKKRCHRGIEPAEFLEGIGKLGRLLADHLPVRDDDDDELPNRPRAVMTERQ